MIYVLDHHYAIDHQDYCIVIESTRSVQEIIEIYAAVEFFLEDLTNYEASVSMECLLDVLIHYYGCKNRKSDYWQLLNNINMPILGLYGELSSESEGLSDVYVIDLHFARESSCGSNYKALMEKWLPKGEALDELGEKLLAGIER